MASSFIRPSISNFRAFPTARPKAEIGAESGLVMGRFEPSMTKPSAFGHFEGSIAVQNQPVPCQQLPLPGQQSGAQRQHGDPQQERVVDPLRGLELSGSEI